MSIHSRTREKWPYLWFSTVVALILAGTVCRILQYLANRSFWMDEAKFALKVMGFSYRELWQPFFQSAPLHICLQPAPLGFFYISKFMVQGWGAGELVLRLFPLVCSIAAPGMMAIVARFYLSRSGTLVAVALLALTPATVYYSSEFHPYSSDILVTLITFGLMQYWKTSPLSRWRCGLSAAGGALLIWFSFPVVFILAGWSTIILMKSVKSRDKKDFLAGLFLISSWAASFGLCYLTYLQFFVQNYIWLEPGFLLSPFSLKGLFVWTWGSVKQSFIDVPLALNDWTFGLIFLTVGGVRMFRQDRFQFAEMMLPIIFVWFAGVAHAYPFHGRLLFFALPIAHILIANGISAFDQEGVRRRRWLFVLMAACFLFRPVQATLRIAAHPIFLEDMRPLLERLSVQKKPGELIYVDSEASYAFHYYRHRFAFDDKECLFGSFRRPDAIGVLTDEQKAKVQNSSGVWLLYAHFIVHPDMLIPPEFQQWGYQRLRHERPGAFLYLYEKKVFRK